MVQAGHAGKSDRVKAAETAGKGKGEREVEGSRIKGGEDKMSKR